MSAALPPSRPVQSGCRGLGRVPTLAGTLIDYADAAGVRLTQEQVDSIPAYQRDIYADDIARLAPAPTEVTVKRAMRLAGWRICEVLVLPETGRVRLIAERRDHDGGTGLQIRLDRWTHGGAVTQTRNWIGLVSGFYTSSWEVDLSHGAGFHVQHSDMSDALLSLAHRVAEDVPGLCAAALQLELAAAV